MPAIGFEANLNDGVDDRPIVSPTGVKVGRTAAVEIGITGVDCDVKTELDSVVAVVTAATGFETKFNGEGVIVISVPVFEAKLDVDGAVIAVSLPNFEIKDPMIGGDCCCVASFKGILDPMCKGDGAGTADAAWGGGVEPKVNPAV